MKRYGIVRSPYPDKFQARAIELLRKAESGQIQADTIFNMLAGEFHRNRKIDRRLKEGKLTIKVIRGWAKARPNLPELLRGEIVTTFEQAALKETYHLLMHDALAATIASTVNSIKIPVS